MDDLIEALQIFAKSLDKESHKYKYPTSVEKMIVEELGFSWDDWKRMRRQQMNDLQFIEFSEIVEKGDMPEPGYYLELVDGYLKETLFEYDKNFPADTLETINFFSNCKFLCQNGKPVTLANIIELFKDRQTALEHQLLHLIYCKARDE